MSPILEVNLKVFERMFRTRRVKFAGAVTASNTREPLVLNVLWLNTSVWPADLVGVTPDGSVSHGGLEHVLRVFLLKIVESLS